MHDQSDSLGSSQSEEFILEMSGGPEELTSAEADRLATLREVVERYRREELNAAGAIREIREKRLYRPGTWEAFCRDQLPVDIRHANRLIAYATLVDEMGPRGPAPTCEKQARWLAPLSDQQRNWVAKQVDGDTRGHGFEGATAERVRDLAREATGETGAEVVPIDKRMLVLTDRRGAGSLEGSGFLPLLDAMAEAARGMRRLGLHALPTAIEALGAVPSGERAARRNQIEVIQEVAMDLFRTAVEVWPDGVPEDQERLFVPPVGRAEHPELGSRMGPALSESGTE